jgi:hypothetical protein
MTDEELIAAAAAEIDNRGGMELHLRPQTVLTLCGLLQLVLRHPALTDTNSRRVAVTVLEHGREYFAGCPAVLEMLRRGDDAQFDT